MDATSADGRCLQNCSPALTVSESVAVTLGGGSESRDPWLPGCRRRCWQRPTAGGFLQPGPPSLAAPGASAGSFTSRIDHMGSHRFLSRCAAVQAECSCRISLSRKCQLAVPPRPGARLLAPDQAPQSQGSLQQGRLVWDEQRAPRPEGFPWVRRGRRLARACPAAAAPRTAHSTETTLQWVGAGNIGNADTVSRKMTAACRVSS